MFIAIPQRNEKSQFGDYRDILATSLDFFLIFSVTLL